jgi:hypothetical protein
LCWRLPSPCVKLYHGLPQLPVSEVFHNDYRIRASNSSRDGLMSSGTWTRSTNLSSRHTCNRADLGHLRVGVQEWSREDRRFRGGAAKDRTAGIDKASGAPTIAALSVSTSSRSWSTSLGRGASPHLRTDVFMSLDVRSSARGGIKSYLMRHRAFSGA